MGSGMGTGKGEGEGEGWGMGAGAGEGFGSGEGAGTGTGKGEGEGWGWGAGAGTLISHSWDLLMVDPDKVQNTNGYVHELVTDSWWFDIERNELTHLRLAHEPEIRPGFLLLSAQEALDWL